MKKKNSTPERLNKPLEFTPKEWPDDDAPIQKPPYKEKNEADKVLKDKESMGGCLFWVIAIVLFIMILKIDKEDQERNPKETYPPVDVIPFQSMNAIEPVVETTEEVTTTEATTAAQPVVETTAPISTGVSIDLKDWWDEHFYYRRGEWE